MKQAGYIDPDTGVWAGDDDQDQEDISLYDQIIQAANQYSTYEDKEIISAALYKLAEIYLKSEQMNAGFHTVKKFVDGIRELLDTDDDSDFAVTTILNKIVSEMRISAGSDEILNRPDSPDVIKQLTQAASQAPEVPESSISEDTEDDEPTYVGQKGQNLGNTEVDTTEGLPEDGAKGKGKTGWGLEGPKALKDMAYAYSLERNEYKNSLNNITDPAAISKTNELIAILQKLETLSERKKALLPHADNDAFQAEIKNVNDEYEQLRQDRVALKLGIRNYLIKNKIKNLTAELSREKDPKKKFLLQEKIDLNNLLLSDDQVGKRKETILRKKLIDTLENKGWLSPDLIAKEKAKIEAVSNKKIPKRKSDITEPDQKSYNQLQYEKIKAKTQSLSLEGLSLVYKTSLASIKMGIKNKITAYLITLEDTRYAPYKEQIKNAKLNNDAAAEKQAKDTLQKILNADAERHNSIKNFINWTEDFNTFIMRVKQVDMAEKSNKPFDFDLLDIISMGEDVLRAERERKSSVGGRLSKLEIALVQIIKELKQRANIGSSPDPSQQILNRKVRVQIIDNETGEITTEEMAMQEAIDAEEQATALNKRIKILGTYMNKNQRKLALNKLVQDSKKKVSQVTEQTVNNESNIDEEVHQIFLDCVNNIRIPGIDD
jgi:hypothetical protein